MKRTLWLVPLLALAAFAGYHHPWNRPGRTVDFHWPRLSPETPRYDPLEKYRYLDGRQDAGMALARGRLVILSCGKPAHWQPEYREVLRRDYAIEQRTVAGCIVTDELEHYVAAFNEVMERRIAATLGDQVFADARKKAEALYTERHPTIAQSEPNQRP